MPSGPRPKLVWRSPSLLEVDGVEYSLINEPSVQADRLDLLKNRELIEEYEPIFAEFQGANCVELGIYKGGSTAFLAQMLRPRRFVAVDIATEPVDVLEAFVRERSFADVVRTFFGVDQSNRAALTDIITAEFGTDPLDLVIDDASHLYHPTLASFEALFPRLRPGGLYVIEDWRSDSIIFSAVMRTIEFPDSPLAAAVQAGFTHALGGVETFEIDPRLARLYVNAMRRPGSRDHAVMSEWYDDLRAKGEAAAPTVALLDRMLADPSAPDDAWNDEAPTLVALGAELFVVASERPDVVSSVAVDRHWITVRRGPAEIDGGEFRLERITRDLMGLLSRSNKGSPRTLPSDGPPPAVDASP